MIMAEATATQLAQREDARADLERRLSLAFEAAPVQDGFSHPAEAVLRDAFDRDPAAAARDVCAIVENPANPARAADTLRCLGRVHSAGSPTWRAALIQDALASTDLEVRDAAIAAVEVWEDARLLSGLRSHHEPVDWLRRYLDAVIRDLES